MIKVGEKEVYETLITSSNDTKISLRSFANGNYVDNDCLYIEYPDNYSPSIDVAHVNDGKNIFVDFGGSSEDRVLFDSSTSESTSRASAPRKHVYVKLLDPSNTLGYDGGSFYGCLNSDFGIGVSGQPTNAHYKLFIPKKVTNFNHLYNTPITSGQYFLDIFYNGDIDDWCKISRTGDYYNSPFLRNNSKFYLMKNNYYFEQGNKFSIGYNSSTDFTLKPQTFTNYNSSLDIDIGPRVSYVLDNSFTVGDIETLHLENITTGLNWYLKFTNTRPQTVYINPTTWCRIKFPLTSPTLAALEYNPIKFSSSNWGWPTLYVCDGSSTTLVTNDTDVELMSPSEITSFSFAACQIRKYVIRSQNHSFPTIGPYAFYMPYEDVQYTIKTPDFTLNEISSYINDSTIDSYAFDRDYNLGSGGLLEIICSDGIFVPTYNNSSGHVTSWTPFVNFLATII